MIKLPMENMLLAAVLEIGYFFSLVTPIFGFGTLDIYPTTQCYQLFLKNASGCTFSENPPFLLSVFSV